MVASNAATSTSIFFACAIDLITFDNNQQKRLGEVREFKTWIDNKPAIENFFFGCDFNFYNSSGPSYDTLVNCRVYLFNDPLPAGNWDDNSSYASMHTQITRADQFGGRATGGLDDRFDFILR